MRVLLFQTRFEDDIRNGLKISTIRGEARCRPGDTLSLRKWSGKPYRTKQVILGEVRCVTVKRIRLYMSDDDKLGVTIDGLPSRKITYLNALASIEGFSDFRELTQWFQANHGISKDKSFEGAQIIWDNSPFFTA